MSTPVVQANSTYQQIELTVRRLIAASGQSNMPSSVIQQATNTYYNNDFPYGIKMDQMKSVYTFFTRPYIDRYPIDVNYIQGIRAPLFVDGIQGSFFKDRQAFFSVWPRFPTIFNSLSGNGIQKIFSGNIPGPILSKEFVLGGTDINGNAISVNDDGFGNLRLQVPNPITSTPPAYVAGLTNQIPGMYNTNLGNPGLNNVNTQTATYQGVGNVNYVTGNFTINFPVAPADGTKLTGWASQYQPGKPYCLMFWNNELTIRPVPKLIHKIEIECYLSPVQFLNTTDSPILNQWWQLIAYGVAREILRQAQDFDGVENLREGFERQEALVLERQTVEELFVPTPTIFSSPTNCLSFNAGFGFGGGW